MMIRIQQADFSVAEEYRKLHDRGNRELGAICTFTGLVREFGDQKEVRGIFLEHYPGMTERSLQQIIDQAKSQWQLHDVVIIHRIGYLAVTDQIVFVGVSSAHRAEAFAACEFIMDFLKVDAPFWKKECLANGEHWVEAKQSDQQRAEQWARNKDQ